MDETTEPATNRAVADGRPVSTVRVPGHIVEAGGAAPAHGCVHRRFEEQAARTPDAVAVVFYDERLSYRDLNARANRLARHLAELGVGPEARVAICLERGAEMVAAILAVLKAGGAYVPLDPGYPAERLELMLADCGAAALVTREGLRAALPARAGVPVVRVDADAAAIAAQSAEDLDSAVDPRSLAYVIYTSGSTGTPKGVAVEHGALASHMAWFVRDFGVTPEDRVLLKTPISFDASVWELFAPLVTGARLVVARQGGEREPAYLLRTVHGQGVTLLQLVPSLFRALTEAPGLADCASLRLLFCGGEALPGELCRRHAELLPASRLVNLYGPTECCIDSSTHRCGPGDHDDAVVPIGRPVPGTHSCVLDGALRTVPAGAPGELCIGGAQVARGYLGRPGLTAERFVPDPFSTTPGARLYRSGDRARWRDDGALEYLGRLDEQVKIRGFRVEPGEVEAVLRRHPGVADAAVISREDAPGERLLAAYVVARDGDADLAALEAHLRRSLPAHMVPAAWVALDRLPLAPNGKLDRRALPAPERAVASRERYVAPRTPTEEALEKIWCEVLGVSRVGIDQPFLELGGHSLVGIRVLARISHAFGVDVSPDALLRSGTIEEVAAIVDAGAGAPSTGPVLERVPRGGPLPVSFAQEGAWFFEQFSPGQLAYRAQATIRITGPLDVDALARAFTEIVRRHEIFRTTFEVLDGAPVQRIHAPWRVELPVLDLSHLAEDAREVAAAERARAEFAEAFDTARLPLVRWSLVRLSAHEHVFVNVEHHYLHDGWSFGLLLHELRALYLAYLQGDESPLREPAVQFADFAVWQRKWMETDAAKAGLRYWEETLAGVPPLVLPTDFPRPAVLRFQGAGARVCLSPRVVAETRAFSREHGVTFFATLMAAFQALLARYSGQRDFCVGSALGNRGHVALEDVIGMVVNTVAVRAHLEGDPTGAELVRRVRETTLKAFEHQNIPFLQVVKRIQPERSSDALPICQVAFSFHNAAMPEMEFGGVRLELEEAQNNGSSKFDLQVVAIPRAEQGMAGLEEEVVLVWEYNTDLFRPETIQRIVAHYETLLAALVRHPGRPLSRLALLDDGERRRVVDEWNWTEAPFAAGRTVHALIEAQAAATPDAIALVFGDESLTYREMDARANRLAHRLIGLGAGPEAHVGVCVERSAAMVTAMLAVLKAGAAYLPLDPAYPADRLAYMLDDSGAALLVTQEALRGLLPADGLQVVSVDGDAPAIAAGRADAPRTAVAADNAAYVIYTSGSTGRPKGVQVTHANAAAFFAGMDGRVGGAIPGTWLAVTRIGFDIHVLELLWTLARGFRVIVQPEAAPGREDVTPARQLRRHAVTHLQCTPSLAAMMIAEQGVDALAGLERLLLGGEALPADLAARLEAVLPGRILNMYGPTETTVWSTTHALTGGERTVPIGRPIANTRVYALDDAFGPQPVGVPGELCIGGAGVARGYLGRPGLTAERFVPDPFGAHPGTRLYRTGDRARWRADGVLEYLGRLDQQVKIRGFRIEPGEIETVLRQHAAVRDCAVVARDDGTGEKRLAAYVVALDAEAARPAELRAFLRGKLPEYMVPAAFSLLDRLPLLPNGKLDRRALPAPDAAPDEAVGYVAPAEGAEGDIALIWRELLGRERVGAHDDFFELGGDSLLATRVVIRTRDLLRREVSVVSLFDHRTLAAFARAAAESAPMLSGDDDDMLSGFGDDEPAWAGAEWNGASHTQP